MEKLDFSWVRSMNDFRMAQMRNVRVANDWIQVNLIEID